MKTAEENAEQIWCYLSPYFGARDKGRCKDFIIKLFDDYRNEALEEAAAEVNSYMYEKGLSVTLIDLAERIRALKMK